ncbi:MAG: PilN domain-containing protein [Candidatus Blackburnbacteria bacterium]|nr:PilN domain-containing protein [Candidatus Blackburnbacteria bacterium]
MAAQKKINLAVPEGFENTPFGKIVSWALSAGRAVVVVTELLVILAFLSRFWLDRELVDLNEQNASREVQVKTQSSFEAQFRLAQSRISEFEKLTTSEASPANKQGIAETVQDVARLLPADVSLVTISLTEGGFELSGIALSEGGLSGFVKALNTSQKFADTTIKDITIGVGGATLNFLIEGSFKK